MKIWLKQPGTATFLGPFTHQETMAQLAAGAIAVDYEVLEATGQSFGALKSSADWAALSTVFSSEEIASAVASAVAASTATAEAVVTHESLGGWLIIPALGLILGGISSVMAIFGPLENSSDIPSRYRGLITLDLLITVGFTAFLLYAGFRFFGRRRNAPSTMIGLLMAGAVVNGVVMGINSALGADQIGSVVALVRGVLGAIIWIPYFLVSKRVKGTFVVP